MREGLELAGRYRLERLLGSGGMGEVWRAVDTRLRRAVAVKTLRAHSRADSSLVTRFRREAEIAARLQHPGITVVFDFGEHEGHLFLVMELLEGEDLRSVLSREPRGLPIPRVLELARQIAEALSAAHAGGIVHRDIKPANLMVLESGRVKICDFGIARFAEATAGLTGRGIIGTPSYMAPEQLEGGRIDQRTDLYALGCVLYQLETGRPPFPGDKGIGALMHAHLNVPPPSPCAVRPDVPDELDRLTRALLAKRGTERPADAATVAAKFRAIEDEIKSMGRSWHIRPSDLEVDATVTFAQALEGVTLPIRLTRPERCARCRGTGAGEGTGLRRCPRCDGTGLRKEAAPDEDPSNTACPGCWGRGLIADDPCSACAGRGLIDAARVLAAKIPAGVGHGQFVRLRNKGKPGADGAPDGDLYVRISIRRHPVFGRRGDHLTVTVPMSYTEATQGGEIRVPVFGGPPVTLRLPAATPSGRIFRVRGRGAPRRDGTRGDLLVTMEVHVPQDPAGNAAALREELILRANTPK
ncbi:protein kinase domain-containing protein [Actinomadura formosensis]|uniref:protein kinase domain-containing protein n=1 Tax=Actinomadura formosensis TaxID=60706 RepID=UPI003D913C94